MLARLTLHLHEAVEHTARTSRSVDLEMHDVGASTLQYGDPDADVDERGPGLRSRIEPMSGLCSCAMASTVAQR